MKVLVKQAQRGNSESFIKLIEENKQSLLKIDFGFFQNEEDAADAIQDTILDAYEHIGELKKADFFRTWLIKILINNCNRIFNYNKKNYGVGEIPENVNCEMLNTNIEFMDLLRSLPSDSRLIFQLYYGEQYTTKEIGRILHLNESTIKSRLHRGKVQLKTELKSI